jgi:hypothetical protein
MYVCEHCAQQGDLASENHQHFPVLTALGGLIGAVAAVATGQFLLVPIALAGGAAGDIRCGRCGLAIHDRERAFRLINVTDDPAGQTVPRQPPQCVSPPNLFADPPGWNPLDASRPVIDQQKPTLEPLADQTVFEDLAAEAVPPNMADDPFGSAETSMDGFGGEDAGADALAGDADGGDDGAGDGGGL